MVSIIIPNYNKAKVIEETLQSIVIQKHRDWECIVVDDRSTDDSIEKIKFFTNSDKRFSLYERPKNRLKGASVCRNIGIEKAIGDHIIFLDSDDLLANFCLENRTATFQNNDDCDFLVFQMERFAKTPNKVEKNALELLLNQDMMTGFLNLHSQWQVTSPIYKTDFIRKINGFNEELSSFEDIEIAVKAISFSSKYKVFKNVDSFYRNDENYKTKYITKSQFDLTITNFELFINFVNNSVISKVEDIKIRKDYKNAVLIGYKKLFLSVIILSVNDYKMQNKTIINFFKNNNYLSFNQTFKFYFVHYVLFKAYRIKGLGLYRIINYLYN